jgi:hypothetical protein
MKMAESNPGHFFRHASRAAETAMFFAPTA